MKSLALTLLTAAGLVAGCGEQPSAPAGVPVAQSPSPASATGTLVVTQQGNTPNRTAWYARIETAAAVPVVEKSYPAGPISLAHDLLPGGYRLISWHRACTSACPLTGETGLGPLEEVCGAPFTIAATARITLTVTIEADGACSVGQ